MHGRQIIRSIFFLPLNHLLHNQVCKFRVFREECLCFFWEVFGKSCGQEASSGKNFLQKRIHRADPIMEGLARIECCRNSSVQTSDFETISQVKTRTRLMHFEANLVAVSSYLPVDNVVRYTLLEVLHQIPCSANIDSHAQRVGLSPCTHVFTGHSFFEWRFFNNDKIIARPCASTLSLTHTRMVIPSNDHRQWAWAIYWAVSWVPWRWWSPSCPAGPTWCACDFCNAGMAIALWAMPARLFALILFPCSFNPSPALFSPSPTSRAIIKSELRVYGDTTWPLEILSWYPPQIQKWPAHKSLRPCLKNTVEVGARSPARARRKRLTSHYQLCLLHYPSHLHWPYFRPR